MAAQLFSTSLPRSNEVEVVEVKKNFIQLSEPELTSENICERNSDQPHSNNSVGEEGDGWQAAHPTLRERSVYCLLIGPHHIRCC